MKRYIATFYTHHAALCTHRAMVKADIVCRMAPVPRALSASCGTCVFFEAEHPSAELLDADFERLVEENPGGGYDIILENT